ncbi:MAG: hypothetical protein HYR56_02935 [Acidobacteria bacterium]|nr:hypothetical protein [Acidobacteriota bacterium]MBI3427996.1 hypothetical protein [Acidobacteriota bacterium]
MIRQSRAAGIGLLISLACALSSATAQKPAQPTQRLPVLYDAKKLGAAALQKREKLLVPKLAGRAANVASATRRPWIDANGWRIGRNPAGKFYYEVPAGKAALALAEAFVYNADAIVKIEEADAAQAETMLAFLRTLPPANWPGVADLGVIDDGSPDIGEVLNLLTRRNLLFRIVKTPAPDLRLNIQLGTQEFPREAAADPSEFVLRVRRQLTDEQRSLRLYGTELVICRMQSDGPHARVHLLNYSGRDMEGVRVRLRSVFGSSSAYAFGVKKVTVEDFALDATGTEFTLDQLGAYTVVDLSAAK